MSNLKKGAMFGLDARVALAIFGALSVITGAALYKAIQEAKVTALITEFEEIGKAYDQYLLDTGLETETVFGHYRHTDKLLENVTVPTKGWNGPYLSYADYPDVSTHRMKHAVYDMVFISEAESTSGEDQVLCLGVEPCYLWPGINGMPLDLLKQIDAKLDNGDGDKNGRFRYRGDGHAFYRYRLTNK
ncbi:MAG: hypothetical protein GY793_05675 [Proteobacteria bacterium]|nr:hypothetical protein [Pseudomonadota bacterium]